MKFNQFNSVYNWNEINNPQITDKLAVFHFNDVIINMAE